MAGPFRFLDRINQLVAGPSSVATTVRDAVLPPGGDRLVTRAGDASRISAADVRAHVVGVALDVLRERVRPGLVDALREHLDEVRAEYELFEGPCPEEGTGSFRRDQWCVNLMAAAELSFRDGDAHDVIPNMVTLEPDVVAAVVLAAPVDDPDAVLARVGLTAAVLDEIVAAIRKPPQGPQRADYGGESLPVDETHDAQPTEWSLERLAASWAFTGEPGDAELFREAATYVLTEPEMIDTGAELLGLAGDKAFLAWARERAAFSDAVQDEADVAEVLRLAGAGRNEEGGGASEAGFGNDNPETAAGGEGAEPPAAQPLTIETMITLPDDVSSTEVAEAFAGLRSTAAARKIEDETGAVPKDNKQPRLPPPVAAEESALTRAAGAALAALYDHGCETDKAMAEALDVQKAVVNQSRHGKTPWAPDAAQRDQLLGLVTQHLTALEAARDGLLRVSNA